MDIENLYRLNAKTETAFISGALRVAIAHEFNFLRLGLDGLIFAWLAWAEVGSWSRSSLFSRVIMVCASVTAVADLVYQMTGSETIVFSADGLEIRTGYFGWERVRHYPIDNCSDLSWRPENDRKHGFALECKVGWKNVRFGKYLNEAQAWSVLEELQRYLPDVAQKMRMSLGEMKSHTTRLGLG